MTTPDGLLRLGLHVNHQVPDAGHNLPQETPGAFADAVLEVAQLGVSARTG